MYIQRSIEFISLYKKLCVLKSAAERAATVCALHIHDTLTEDQRELSAVFTIF